MAFRALRGMIGEPGEHAARAVTKTHKGQPIHWPPSGFVRGPQDPEQLPGLLQVAADDSLRPPDPAGDEQHEA